MTSRGVHFALSATDLRRVLAASDPDDLQELISEDIEERYLSAPKARWAFETDKAWDALHRSLTDGQLLYESGPFPLAYAVLGGRPLDVGDDYTACLTTPAQVAEVAAALPGVSRDWLRARYWSLDPLAYGSPLSDEDFEYTWSSFLGLPAFFARAAKARRAVLFTTDQ
jgi:hypothetical protein